LKGGEKQMTKIIAGTAGLIATVALVGVAAFAQFTTQVQANNVTFTTGTAELELSLMSPVNWQVGPFNALGTPFDKFIPGIPQTREFQIRNVGDVPLLINMRLTSAPVGWEDLKDEIELRIYRTGSVPAGDDEYRTLNGWNALNGHDLGVLGVAVSPGPVTTGVPMTVETRLKAGSTASGKSVSTDWVLTGTQTNLVPNLNY
jgi:hypothetical protein